MVNQKIRDNRRRAVVGLGAGHRLAHQPVDGGELGAGQLVGVADDLVDDVGLRRVQRLRRVAQVLGGVEDGVGEGAVEVPQRGQAGDRVVAEPGDRLEAAADLGELGDVVGGQAELLLGLQERPAGVGVVERLQLAGDDPPHLVLDDRVVGPGDGVPGLPVDGTGRRGRCAGGGRRGRGTRGDRGRGPPRPHPARPARRVRTATPWPRGSSVGRRRPTVCIANDARNRYILESVTA